MTPCDTNLNASKTTKGASGIVSDQSLKKRYSGRENWENFDKRDTGTVIFFPHFFSYRSSEGVDFLLGPQCTEQFCARIGLKCDSVIRFFCVSFPFVFSKDRKKAESAAIKESEPTAVQPTERRQTRASEKEGEANVPLFFLLPGSGLHRSYP